jgi:hypothetical protein
MSVHVVEDSSSDRCLAVVKHWLRDCSEHHPMCTHATLSPLPTQVINVGSSVDSRDPFLYETLSECARYMTLSYCWGDRHPIKTTQGSLSRYRGGIPWSDLPRTFQDAIDITHRLGIKYLWIDSLCIVQDDPDDWQRESAQMASIFGSSYLTISASHGRDAEVGCFSLDQRASSTTTEKTMAKNSRSLSGSCPNIVRCTRLICSQKDYPTLEKLGASKSDCFPSALFTSQNRRCFGIAQASAIVSVELLITIGTL